MTKRRNRVVESLVSGSREIFNADLAVTRVDSLIADALDIAQARGIPRDNPLLAMLVITDAALTFQMNRVPGHPTEPALRLLARYTDLATLQKFCGAIVGSAKLSLRLAGMDGTPIYAEQVSTMLTELTHAFHCERDRARFGTVRDAACKLEVAFLEVQPDRPTDRLAELWALELSRDPGPEFPPGLGNGLN